MSIRRKSHNIDEQLLRRAQRTLGTNTETAAIHEALRAIVLAEDLVADLAAARSPRAFHPEFIQQMRRERHRAS